MDYLSRDHFLRVRQPQHSPFSLYPLLVSVIAMDARLRRVNKEIAGMFTVQYSVNDPQFQNVLADCKNDKTSNIRLDLVGESPFHLKGSFPGPEGTPYEGGHFEVVGRPLLITLATSDEQSIVMIGHLHSRFISIPARQNEVHHESLSPERFFCIWRDLSRHPQRRLVSGTHLEVDSDFATESFMFPRA
jgi:hypothetical protein